MEFDLMFAKTGPFVQAEGLTLLAQTAEEVGVESNSKPLAGKVPIIVGGHSKASARRAARLGDGFPGTPRQVRRVSEGTKAERERMGRDPGEIEVTTGSIPKRDEVKSLEDMGVSRFVIGPPGSTPDALRKGLERLGNQLISKF